MAPTTTTSRRLRELKPGDRIRLQSLSGGSHELTVVHGKRDPSGLFVRLATGKLARLSPGRIDWQSLERLGASEFVSSGDEVIVVALGGMERRGKLEAPIDDRVHLSLHAGETYSVPLEELELREFRLLFPTTKVRVGDEFLVRSCSGKEYRGIARVVTETHISATLRPTREQLRLQIARLDMNTMNVLIPVYGASDPPTWAGVEQGASS